MKFVGASAGRMSLALLTVSFIFAVACGGGSTSGPTGTPNTNSATATANSESNVPTPGAGGGIGTPATRPLCTAIDDFRSSLVALGGSRNANDLKANAQAVGDSAERVKTTAQNARVAGSDQLEMAIDDFKTSIDTATSADRPVAQTLAAISSAVLRIQDSVEQARANGGC
jgi:hypothetical protein